MNPGLLGGGVAARWAYRAHARAAQAAISTVLQTRPRRPFADRDVCRLSDALAQSLGAETAARTVRCGANAEWHIHDHRSVASSFVADLVLERIADALAHPAFLALPVRPGRFAIIGGTARRVLVALELVSAAQPGSGSDEWWVRTAYPVGERRLQRLLKAGRLRAL
jgi:hypothetical protein